MIKPKVFICYPFVSGPWGGGNQFLSALRKKFIDFGVYEEEPEKADIIVFNSHHQLVKVLRLKKYYPHKFFIHRLDGPLCYIRGRGKYIDKVIYKINKFVADGSIFQSDFCYRKNIELGHERNKPFTIIHNAPDSNIFNREGKVLFSPQRKIRLIATSWSPNWNKGFETYLYIDNHLDFKRYEMTFVGNSPVKFNNIKMIAPVNSQRLSCLLKKNDIFITASKKDPCSNSLIEALHCGLPAIVYKDGGHPELINNGGMLFTNDKEVISLIEEVSGKYEEYVRGINIVSIESVSNDYYEFMKGIYTEHVPVKLHSKPFLELLVYIYFAQFFTKLNSKIITQYNHVLSFFESFLGLEGNEKTKK